jgi:rRNA-processing protein FCF1
MLSTEQRRSIEAAAKAMSEIRLRVDKLSLLQESITEPLEALAEEVANHLRDALADDDAELARRVLFELFPLERTP